MSEFTNNEYCVIRKHKGKGDDGHKYVSIRVREEMVAILDDLSIKTEQSRNAIINTFILYGIKHCKIEE